MERIALKHLQLWKDKKNRKPLVIRGARQVGKTALVRLFCKRESLDLIEINLEEKKLFELDKEGNFDVDRAINEILALTQKTLSERSILFLDEIQESMLGYERLRFFYEKRPEIPIIVAGSLLELELKRQNINTPVGRVEYLFLGPMTFGEFLLAGKKNIYFKELQKFTLTQEKNHLSPSIHDELESLFKEYLFVGGMPEAVKNFYQNNGNFLKAREVQSQILEAYYDDIRKYETGKIVSVIQEVFTKYSIFLGEKVKYLNLSSEKSTYVEKAIETLENVFLLKKIYHTNASGLPLSAGENLKIFKLFHLDIGLYNCQMNLNWQNIVSKTENNLLTIGRNAEQFIYQHLSFCYYRTTRPNIFYWLKDKSSNKAEVDFIIEREAIYPIEVKSGKSGSIKSLIQFMKEKKGGPIPIRFDMKYRQDFREETNHKIENNEELIFTLKSFPLYAVEFLF